MPNWTKEWQPFTGYYEKEMVDITCKDGTQINVCWPNAGFMNPCGEDGKDSIPYDQVAQVRLSNSPGWWNS